MSNKSLKIQNIIYEIRRQKVMLDRDLAELYGGFAVVNCDRKN
jgi:hypothetical protein